MWCGVVWCGVVWCGVVWCLRCGVVWSVAWCGLWRGTVWCGVRLRRSQLGAGGGGGDLGGATRAAADGLAAANCDSNIRTGRPCSGRPTTKQTRQAQRRRGSTSSRNVGGGAAFMATAAGGDDSGGGGVRRRGMANMTTNQQMADSGGKIKPCTPDADTHRSCARGARGGPWRLSPSAPETWCASSRCLCAAAPSAITALSRPAAFAPRRIQSEITKCWAYRQIGL